jgi:hypothetical protein
MGMVGMITVIDPSVGIEEFTIADLSIFPSPATNKIQIKLGDYEGEAELFISDMKGSVMLSEKILMTNGQQEINVSDLHPAMYILTTVQNDTKIVSKFIVE